MKLVIVLALVSFALAQIRIPIGGALQVDSNILDLFKGKKVAYFTCAGDTPEQDAETYRKFFAQRQIAATWVPIYGSNCAHQVNNATHVQTVNDVDAVFFSGGLSGNIQTCLFGGKPNYTETPVLAAIHTKEIVAGTSAGGMVQPTRDMMITGMSCESYACVSARSVYYRKDGFNLFTHGLVDVHFAERGRQGRLYVLMWQTNSAWGYGVDENTALVQYPDGRMVAMGQTGVLVYDASRQNMTTFESGLMVHFLTEGDTITPEGKITWASYKSPCTTQTAPQDSRNIFTDFRARSIDTAMYDKPDYEYRGYVGSRPVVQVSLKRSGATVAMCGTIGGKKHISFANLFYSISTKSFAELRFVGEEPNVVTYPYDY